jgi:hypothetical protein
MNQLAPNSSSTKNRTVSEGAEWHTLYHAALFETDRTKVPQRIAEAENAILERSRVLLMVDADHIEEEQILDDALYALRALRNRTFPEPNVA